ncbi:MAG: 30S ribosomal protein S6 [Candidatus Paceibacterota bacterium]|jgi:ribosomal protein S6
MQDSDLVLENNTENTADSRIYEVGYLLAPTIAEEKIAEHYTGLKDLIASLGGATIADEIPRMLPLAYTIEKVVQNVRSKYDTAYFGWNKFEMSPAQVLELKKKLDLDPNFVRFLLIKTVRENTVAAKRFMNRDGIRRKAPVAGENEVVAPINKEEVDKEIDAMVAAV